MRRNILFTIALAMLAFQIPLSAFSQYNVSGSVSDAESGDPLVGANVVADNTGPSTSTDLNGKFKIEFTRTDIHKIRISFVGYKPVTKTVDVSKSSNIDVLLSKSPFMTEEVIVSATRSTKETPTTYSKIGREEIERYNTGQDLPYILQLTPSVVTSSDAGTGIGYTGIRLRGTDITRINVTMNGVPVNDPESHGVYFVDLPDIASSVENIQIQRGVGTSTNGAAAFGGSINIKTTGLNPDPYAEINSAAGSFNTFKNTLHFGSGLINGKWAFDGRLSSITSDGYIDRGWSDLKSMYLSGGYYGDKTILKAIVTSGKEKTYQAWNGTPKDSLATNRIYNPSGEMYDKNGNITGYYDNETDNYRQDYYQLHFAHRFSSILNMSAALFYTHGEGYYENYRNMDTYADYGLENIIIGNDTLYETNLVRQKWLDNDFYGANLAFKYSSGKIKTTLGGGWNTYSGDHYGYIVWAENAGNSFIDKPWYFNTGEKTDFNVFLKANYQVTSELNLYGDLQMRSINYSIKGNHDDLRDLTQSHDFFFFNPKAGLLYKLDQNSNIYASVAIANREPNRGVYRDADPGQDIRSERLTDYELGYRYGDENLQLEANFYYMDYKDQLVLTGQINNVGDPILVNVPKSYRTGIEVSGSLKLSDYFRWDLTGTFSRNKIENFVSYTDDWDTWSQLVDTLGTTNISFSPDLVGASNLQFEIIEDFQLSLISRYVGRQYIDNTANTDRSLDPYFVNDLRFDYTFHPKLLKSVRLFFTIQNFLNAEYETNAWVYPYYENGMQKELNGYFPQAMRNFIGGVYLNF